MLVAPRDNPKGATFIIPGETPGTSDMKPFMEILNALPPQAIIEIMAMQERRFGDGTLNAPPEITQEA